MLGLEKEFWDAIKAKDGGAASRLTADTCMIAGASGVMEVDRQTMGQMLSQDGYDLKDYKVDDFKVRPLADGIVAVAYKSTRS